MSDSSSLFENELSTQTASDVLRSTEAIPGVGEKRAEELSEKGIETLQDLFSEEYEVKVRNSSVRQQFSDFFVKQSPSPFDIGLQDMPSVFLLLAKIATRGTLYMEDGSMASSVKDAQCVRSRSQIISVAKGRTPDAHGVSLSGSSTVETITDPDGKDALFLTEYEGDDISEHPEDSFEEDTDVEETRWTLIDPKFLRTVSLLFGRDYTKPENISLIKIIGDEQTGPIVVHSPDERCSALIANMKQSSDINPWERQQKDMNTSDRF